MGCASAFDVLRRDKSASVVLRRDECAHPAPAVVVAHL